MKKTSSILKIICLVLIILCITNNVSKAAEYGATMTLTGSKTTAYIGETVTYTLLLKSATNVEGVATVHAKINYDSSVLQYVSCEATNSWSSPVYNSENNEFVTERSDVMKPEGEIIKITFKVIAVPNEKTTTVSITNFDVADTENEITVLDVSANLQIEENDNIIDIPDDDNKEENKTDTPKDDNDKDNNEEKDNNNVEDNNNTIDNEPNNNIDNSQNTEKDNNTTNDNQNKDNTIHTGSIPQTGMYTIIPVIATVIIAISVIMYIKYKNMKDIN